MEFGFKAATGSDASKILYNNTDATSGVWIKGIGRRYCQDDRQIYKNDLLQEYRIGR